VKNIQSKKVHPDSIKDLDYKTSSAFALFWNMAKAHIDDDIIADFTKIFDEIGIFRMDANTRLPPGTGVYTVEVEGIPIEFHNVELAPPQGMLAINYAR